MNKEITKISKPPPPNRVEISRHSNDVVRCKTCYVNDRKHGMETVWNEAGGKMNESVWNRGKKQGVRTWWYKNGSKHWQETRSRNKEHGVTTNWHQNGSKQKEIYYIREKEYARIEWDDEGNISGETFPNVLINTITKLKKSYRAMSEKINQKIGVTPR